MRHMCPDVHTAAVHYMYCIMYIDIRLSSRCIAHSIKLALDSQSVSQTATIKMATKTVFSLGYFVTQTTTRIFVGMHALMVRDGR